MTSNPEEKSSFPERPEASPEEKEGATPTLGMSGAAGHAVGWPDPEWDRYRCDRLLGSGGMGRVFKAWDPRLRRWVALKFLTSDDPELTTRFLREARAQARIEHPHICRVYEVGETAGRPYIAMQFIDGQPLSACAERLTLEQKVLVIRQVAEAIHTAHRLGIIHRDLKPANIMLEESETEIRPGVVDFGLVREVGVEGLTVSGAALGTPQFMAPEQALGKMDRVDRRTDVYSLGATLYTLIAGRPPLSGETAVEAILRVLHDDPPPLRKIVPTVPQDLDTVVMKCLEKDPSRRYDSARALAEDLGRFLDGEPVAARPAGWIYQIGKRVRKNRLLVGVIAAAVLATLVLLSLWWRDRRAAAERAEIAQRFTQKVERVEGLLWRAQSLPPHDIRPEREQVRRQLADIEAEMQRLGSLAEGAGYSALGRGYIALHQYARGRELLERAWRGGQKTPEVSFALGLALGKLYQSELGRLKSIPDPDARKARRTEIERTLREPAQSHLRACAGEELVAPEYVEALLAYYENRDVEALAKARAALRKIPWLYEALVLEGDLFRRQGEAAVAEGGYDSARTFYQRAAEAYRRAVDVGRSDMEVYSQLARLWYGVFYMEVWNLGQGTLETYQKTVSACGDALRVDPDSVETMAVLADTHANWAEQQFNRGGDVSATLEAGRAAVERALRLEPDNVQLLTSLGGVVWQQGKEILVHGGDPRPLFEEGQAFLKRAVKVQPDYFNAWNNLGLIFMDQALYERTIRIDPAETIRGCTEAFQRAWRLAPKNVALPLNLAMAELTLLEHEVATRTGRPDQTAARARTALNEAGKLNANLYWLPRIRGQVDLEMAKEAMGQGRDPSSLLASAEMDFRRGLELNPDDGEGYWMLCDIRLAAAEYALRSGRSAARLLAEAETFLRRAAKMIPGRPETAQRQRQLAALWAAARSR
jgi:tetratricopeptide (TPR) repeat protein/predicted Ser/Thr protein kinase